ncbi:MAG: nuclear transport factor 2 family protein [Candidatus Tectomicrobia bacterium]|nr:nuclear transport factor 2 family protein [Candidatus Tectomicrobia bacterium]
MAEEHVNVSLLKRLDLDNMAAAAALFAQDVVWHFFNPLLPDVQGDYAGLTGVRTFFEKIRARTDDTFQVEPISMAAVGDELVVTHTKNRMTLQGRPIATDVVVVWRIVDGRIAEVWDIPSVHTASPRPQG